MNFYPEAPVIAPNMDRVSCGACGWIVQWSDRVTRWYMTIFCPNERCEQFKKDFCI